MQRGLCAPRFARLIPLALFKLFPASPTRLSFVYHRFFSAQRIFASESLTYALAMSSSAPSVRTMGDMKRAIVDLVCSCAQEVYNTDVSAAKDDVYSKLVKPPKPEFGEVSLPCFAFSRFIKGPPAKVAEELGAALKKRLEDNKSVVDRCEVSGPYLNFYIPVGTMASIIPAIVDGSFVANRPTDGQPRVMIEYSQPNTHKAFHVGHMRNAALGNCLVSMYTRMGYPVVACNYFGDEGAHVAKCLWFLRRHLQTSSDTLEGVEPRKRGEWLGDMYARAVEALDLSLLTSLPHPGVFSARVVSVGPHPNASAPAGWHVVQVECGDSGRHTVVCGGNGYKEGDVVAYVRVGGKLKGVEVTPKDMMGVESHGVILAERELGIEPRDDKKDDKRDDKKDAAKKDDKKDDNKKDDNKKDDKKDKKAAIEARQALANNRIFLLPEGTASGVELTELGRRADIKLSDGVETVSAEMAMREREGA
jgi:tRNA-binding EMAP/Myf-like protein